MYWFICAVKVPKTTMFKKAEMQNGSTAIELRKINKGKHSVFPRRFCETMVVLTQEESFAHFKVKCVNMVQLEL